jgi:Domain of unknown function (DUF4476)
MKKYIAFLSVCLLSLSAVAQQYNNTVTININSSSNPQITLDGKNYTLNSNVSAGKNTIITLYDLAQGQHSLQVRRSYQRSGKLENTRTVFLLRQGYNMRINLTGNGSFELIESPKKDIANTGTPMTNEAFAILLRNVKVQNTTTKRKTVIANAIDDPNRYFTSLQVRQLLQQVNSESYRLELAKLSYPKITDQENFYQLNNLFSSQASRQELEDYADNYQDDPYPDAVAMTDSRFNELYQDAGRQWSSTSKINYLTAAFNNNSNYFTTTQAIKLITLVNNETNRLELARLSYRTITDPGNFYQMNSLLNNQSSKDNLAAYVDRYDRDISHQNPIGDASFTQLYTTIQQQWPVATQVSSISAAFDNNSNNFTTSQASQLIQLVPDNGHRLHLAKSAYNRITDPERFSDLYSLISNTAQRSELMIYVSKRQSGEQDMNPMNDLEYNTLYQSIERQFLPNEQMSSLTAIFNKSGNYFSTAQTRKLILLVSYETNRLQLAKLSYRTITDRERFNELYDLLERQSTRDELDAYAKAYND